MIDQHCYALQVWEKVYRGMLCGNGRGCHRGRNAKNFSFDSFIFIIRAIPNYLRCLQQNPPSSSAPALHFFLLRPVMGSETNKPVRGKASLSGKEKQEVRCSKWAGRHGGAETQQIDRLMRLAILTDADVLKMMREMDEIYDRLRKRRGKDG